MCLKWKSWELFNCSFDIGLINNLVLSWCSSWPCVGPPQFASGFRFMLFFLFDRIQKTTWFILLSPPHLVHFSSQLLSSPSSVLLSLLFSSFTVRADQYAVCSSQLLAVVLHNWPCVWDLSVIHSSSFAVGCTVHTYKPNVWHCWFQSLLCLITVEVSTRLECSGCG